MSNRLNIPMRAWGLIFLLCFPLKLACSNGTGLNGSPLASSSGTDGEKKDQDTDDNEREPEIDPEGSDVPVWVNGSYLTCHWSTVINGNIAQADCWVQSSAGGEPAGIEASWTVAARENPSQNFEAIATNSSGTQASIHIPRMSMFGSSIAATVKGGSTNSTAILFSTKIIANDQVSFQACAENSSRNLEECFQIDRETAGKSNSTLNTIGGSPEDLTEPLADQTNSNQPRPSGEPLTRESAEFCDSNGQCYWFSGEGQSCVEFCRSNGVIEPALRAIGSDLLTDDDPFAEACNAIIASMTTQYAFSYNFIGPPNTKAIGCGYRLSPAGQILRRAYIGTPTTPEASDPKFFRVCTCKA